MDLIDEIAADIKSEENFKTISKFLPWIIIFTILAIVIAICYTIQDNNKKISNLKYNDKLFDLIAKKNDFNNSSIYKDIANYNTYNLPVSDLAKINLNAIMADYMSAKDSKRIVNLDNNAKLIDLENTIKDDRIQELTRAYCYLLWLNELLNLANENIDWQKIEDYDNLKFNKNYLLRGPIELAKALLYIKNNDKTKARTILISLSDDNYVSSYIKDNVNILLSDL